MSMDLYVFSDRPVTSMAEWQAAITADGFDILLHEGAIFEKLSGFLRVRLDGAGTGFETSPYNLEETAELIQEFSDDGYGPDRAWKHVFHFGFVGDYRELIAVMSTAGSYARLTEGVVFEPEAGIYMQPSEVLDEARRLATSLKAELGPPRYEWNDAS